MANGLAVFGHVANSSLHVGIRNTIMFFITDIDELKAKAAANLARLKSAREDVEFFEFQEKQYESEIRLGEELNQKEFQRVRGIWEN